MTATSFFDPLFFQSYTGKSHDKKSTIQNDQYFPAVFQKEFGRREVSEITPDEIMVFLVKITEGLRQSTQNTAKMV